MNPYKLMCIFAHPDDESMGMGATIAKYTSQGVEVSLVCATRGERGWFGPRERNPGLTEMGQIREAELNAAAGVLGVKEVHFLDYVDGDLDRADPVEVIGRITAQLRAVKPQVVVTFPPDGNYGHPDHIAISQFAAAAVVCAADPEYKDPDDQAAHRVSKMYYMVDAEKFVELVSSLMGEITFQVDEQPRGEIAWKEWMVTTRIDGSAHCETALRAIKCHASQLESLGPLAQAPEEMVCQVLAQQGTFYRVFSTVNGGRKVETDLFEGLS